MKISEDNLLTSVIVGSIGLSVVLALSGAILFSSSTGFGIAAGSAIAVINFTWQRSIMRRALAMQHGRPTFFTSVRYLLRLGIAAIAIYFILTSDKFSLAGLFVGLSVVVITIIICTSLCAIQNKGD